MPGFLHLWHGEVYFLAYSVSYSLLFLVFGSYLAMSAANRFLYQTAVTAVWVELFNIHGWEGELHAHLTSIS